jgi:hypothetical protein
MVSPVRLVSNGPDSNAPWVNATIKNVQCGDDNAGAVPVAIKVRENHEIFGVFRT